MITWLEYVLEDLRRMDVRDYVRKQSVTRKREGLVWTVVFKKAIKTTLL